VEQKDVIRSLAALAHPIRLQVFRALVVRRRRSGMTPGTMAEGLAIPVQYPVLSSEGAGTNAGLISQERASRNIIYRAAFGAHECRARTISTENCCQGAECSSRKERRPAAEPTEERS
jgi:DNA-binding transcriptional ArsR family regulator